MFRKPSKKKVGIKMLIYGRESTGKTQFSLSAPNIAMIDTENGATFYEGTEVGKNIKLIANTQSWKELDEAMDYIEENYEDEGIETLVTDSLTKIRQNLSDAVLNVDIKRNRKNGVANADLNSNLSIRSWGTIGTISKRQSNRKIDLSSKMNIIDVAQLKNVTDDNGNVVDQIPDTDKSAPYDYDVKLKFYTEQQQGETKFYALVEKDRTRTYPVGTVLENPTFDNWSDVLDDVSDGEELQTNYRKQVDESMEAYEEDIEKQEQTISDRFQDIGKALDTGNRKLFVNELKEEKIDITKLDKLSKGQIDKVNVVFDKYEKLVK